MIITSFVISSRWGSYKESTEVLGLTDDFVDLFGFKKAAPSQNPFNLSVQ